MTMGKLMYRQNLWGRLKIAFTKYSTNKDSTNQTFVEFSKIFSAVVFRMLVAST